VRRAILKELGFSVREYDATQLGAVPLEIDDVKARMRKEGQRPRGGIHDAAMEEVAKRRGQKGPALEKQLKRFRRRKRRNPAPR
jgi:hypothetical protein